MSNVILGAGPLGTALAARLRASGRSAAVYGIMGDATYDMPGTRPAAVDGADLDSVRRVCTDAAVIFLCMNAHYVDWYRLFPPRVRVAIAVAADTGATLIYHDTLHMYRPGPDPLTEASPWSSATRKGRLRAGLAQDILEACESGRVRGAIGRSADMYGPGALNSSFDSTLGERHFLPLLAGATVRVVGDIDVPHTYAYVGDVAQGLATLASCEEAIGRVWHLPAAPTMTHRELLTLAFDVAGLRPRIRGSRLSGHFVRMIGRFQPDVAEVAEILDQFEEPLIVSHHRFSEAFGAEPTPHRTALERTLAWYRTLPGMARPTDSSQRGTGLADRNRSAT